MTLFVTGLILYFGGKWLSARIDTTMPHLCRTCLQKYYGDACPRCDGTVLVPSSVIPVSSPQLVEITFTLAVTGEPRDDIVPL